jgi:hypothetical protein
MEPFDARRGVVSQRPRASAHLQVARRGRQPHGTDGGAAGLEGMRRAHQCLGVVGCVRRVDRGHLLDAIGQEGLDQLDDEGSVVVDRRAKVRQHGFVQDRRLRLAHGLVPFVSLRCRPRR